MAKKNLWRFQFVLLAACSGSLMFAGPLAAETLTIPAAASLVRPVAPFYSDVRVFNTSYSTPVTVTAVYRCFSGCSSPVAPQVFNLGNRESRAFDDICNQLFGAPNSLGAIEFTTDVSGSLLVTSRLYSPLPPPATSGSVGMFIPGLPSSAAKVVSALTNLMNGDFRTNIGVYNPNPVSVTATIRLFDGPVLLGTLSVPLGPQTGAQLSDIYSQVKFGSLKTTNGYGTVESSVPTAPVFAYAAEADNTTQDTIFIQGEEDVAAPAGFNPPTATPFSGGASPTPTPPPPTPTPTPQSGATVVVNVGQNANMNFSPGTVTVHAGDTVRWDFKDTTGYHSTTSGTCTPDPYYGGSNCSPLPSGLNWDSGQRSAGDSFSQLFTANGTYRYYCMVHGYMMTGTVQVN